MNHDFSSDVLHDVGSDSCRGSDGRSPSGFALVTTLILLSILLGLVVALSSYISLRQQSSAVEGKVHAARQSALAGLRIALGELQTAAGPDQRVTASASILGNSDNTYAGAASAASGRAAWTGVWKSNTVVAPDGEQSQYNPADPDNKTFVSWLVSATDSEGNFTLPGSLGNATTSYTLNDALPLVTNTDGSTYLEAGRVQLEDTVEGSRYFAFVVEDESQKADLSWSEVQLPDAADYAGGTADPAYLADLERARTARLSVASGPDYAQLNGKNGPFGTTEHPLSYPLTGEGTGNAFLEDAIELMRDPVDLQVLMDAGAGWLRDQRANFTWGSLGVLADVKLGGLRRDLSLAFEMDGAAESENATLFNQQTGEFVGSGGLLSSPYTMPGMGSLKARHLFRDYGPNSGTATPGAGNPFSDDITQPATVVRGPTWWLMRDYYNLYKRLKRSGSSHALDARAYYPNRTTVTGVDAGGQPVSFAEDLIDMHAQKNQGIDVSSNYVIATNMETNVFPQADSRWKYAYRPARASYAPVLLGVNALYSLVYKGNQLYMTVDPFFILWNPYNARITTDKYAITLENGFAGGMRFRVTDPGGVETLYGKPSGWGSGRGSDTSFTDFAKRKSGVNANLSYLITGLSMDPGEVMIYSPPNEDDRSSNANVLNDELFPGMNYDASSSGIFFNEFPRYNTWTDWRGRTRWNYIWEPVTLPLTADTDNDGTPDAAEPEKNKIDVLFNIASQSGYAIVNIIETSLPAAGRSPDELTAEGNFGDSLTGNEFRLNLGGGQHSTNIDKGIQWRKRGDGTEVWPFTFSFDELGVAKTSFGILSMLTLPTDYSEADTDMEVFSQLNATPIVRVQSERFQLAPLNIYVNSVSANGINNLMNLVGVDIDAFGSGNNGFYGKNYALAEGDTLFPMIDIPRRPMRSLLQLSGANVGTRLFEPTHAIGSSWKPPYIPQDSIYRNSDWYFLGRDELTVNDVSWQVNDALFDRYYLSGIAPDYGVGMGGYAVTGSLAATLASFYGGDNQAAKVNPVLEPHVPEGKTASGVAAELTPTSSNTDAYRKLGAYSFIKGAFNVNSTSVEAWAAFLRGNRNLAVTDAQGGTDSSSGTPFPLSTTPSDAGTNNGWEKFSRITDDQIWDDKDTPDDPSDDTGLAVEIVKQVKARGPFMSISDFVNRRIGDDERSYQGAIQSAIEQAGINGNQTTGIRSATSEAVPNYSNYGSDFPYAPAAMIGARNNATGIPREINQANVLLPLAPRLTGRGDTFRIRGYGEVRASDDETVVSRAVCEALVQRLPEYVDPGDPDDPNNLPTNNEPWDEGVGLNDANKQFGRRFKIVQFRWLAPDEI